MSARRSKLRRASRTHVASDPGDNLSDKDDRDDDSEHEWQQVDAGLRCAVVTGDLCIIGQRAVRVVCAGRGSVRYKIGMY